MIPRVKRPAVTMLVLATCSALAVGCGANSATISTNSGNLSASTALTRASATAYAHAVNLRATDVPGMSAGSSEGELPQTPSSRRSSSEFTHCFGGVSTNARLVKIHSPEFSAGHGAHAQLVESRIEVWPSAAIVAHNNAAYFSARGQRCFTRLLEATHRQLNKLRAGKLRYRPFRIATVGTPVPGASDGHLTAINEILTRKGHVGIHLYHDIFTFVVGPAEIELEAIGFSKPVPSATEERLLSLLVKRATAEQL